MAVYVFCTFRILTNERGMKGEERGGREIEGSEISCSVDWLEELRAYECVCACVLLGW